MQTLAAVPPAAAPAPTLMDEEVGESPAILSQIAAGILPITMAFPLTSLVFPPGASPPQALSGGSAVTSSSDQQLGAGLEGASVPPPASAAMLDPPGPPEPGGVGQAGPSPGMDALSPLPAAQATGGSIPGGLLQQVRVSALPL